MTGRHAVGWGPLPPAPGAVTAHPAGSALAGADWPDALATARTLLQAGDGLPARWAGQGRCVLLDTRFNLGAGFLAAWAAWRADTQRSARLVVVAIDARPLQRAALQQAHAAIPPDHPLRPLADALAAQWPATTPDLHLLDFDGGRVRLLLAMGNPARVLPDLVLQADAIWLHAEPAARPTPAGEPPPAGDPSPESSPGTWDAHRLRHLQRMAAPGCLLASPALAAAQQQALAAAGFVLQQHAAGGGHAALTLGRFAPRHRLPAPPGRRAQAGTQAGVRRVAVVGAGLAGAAAANALARQGLLVTVFERLGAPAQATSGNAGGLFHSVVHAQDGSHARWLRACALQAEQVLRPLLASGQVPGALAGLLRGEQVLNASAMQAVLHALALPPEHVQVRDQALPAGPTATARATLADPSPTATATATATTGAADAERRPAWFYPGGGWVAPAALVAAWLNQPGITLRCGTPVQQLQQQPDGQWRLGGDTGQALAEVDAVVLCNAHDAQRLLGNPGWPLQRVRGQTTLLRPDTPGLSPAELPLHQPLADGGYALRLADGRLLCGAVSQPGDDEPALRLADHQQHLAALRRLTGWAGDVDAAALDGRVGWRLVADDKLPLLGPVPAQPAAGAKPVTQVRHAPRQNGLWVFTALGSRGITQAALGGELLAAWLTGAPCPAPAALMDALDPARFAVRALRQAESKAATAGIDPASTS